MIHNHEEFETALSEAMQLLAAPPADGTPGHQRLLDLMRDMAAYRPAIRLQTADEAARSAQLSQRLDAFKSQLPAPLDSHWSAMLGGDVSAPGD